LNQEETLKDALKTVEDSYRTTRKLVHHTEKPIKKVYGLTLNAIDITSESLIKLFEKLLNKDILWKTNAKNLKILYKKGIPLSSNDCDIKNLKLFQKIMKNHEVDYSIKKDYSTPGRFNLFFLARDVELIEKALERFIVAERLQTNEKSDFIKEQSIELSDNLEEVKNKMDKLENQIENDKNPKEKTRHEETLKIYQEHYKKLNKNDFKIAGKIEQIPNSKEKESTILKLEKAKDKAKEANLNNEKVKEKKQELSL